jgi:hypothetical protein
MPIITKRDGRAFLVHSQSRLASLLSSALESGMMCLRIGSRRRGAGGRPALRIGLRTEILDG